MNKRFVNPFFKSGVPIKKYEKGLTRYHVCVFFMERQVAESGTGIIRTFGLIWEETRLFCCGVCPSGKKPDFLVLYTILSYKTGQREVSFFSI